VYHIKIIFLSCKADKILSFEIWNDQSEDEEGAELFISAILHLH
jgi:hypothetical protein